MSTPAAGDRGGGGPSEQDSIAGAAIGRIMDLAAQGDPKRLFHALQQAMSGLVYLTASDDGLRRERELVAYQGIERALRGEWPYGART